MIDFYISDSALQILSQLLVLGTYLSVVYLFAARKKFFVFAGVIYAAISTALVYYIYENIFLTVFFCLTILLANRFENFMVIVSATAGYLLVNNISLVISSNQETLFYMMLKLVSLECAYFIFQIFYYIWKEERLKNYLVFLSSVFCFCFGANFLLILYNRNMQLGTRDILFFPVFVNTVLYLVTSSLFHAFINNQRIQEGLKIQQLKNEMVNQQYHVLKEKYEDIFLLKHDMKHHLQTLSILLYQGNHEKAKEYIGQVSGDINKSSLIFTSTNQMLEIVLNEKYSEARKLGIDIEMNCADVALDHINDIDIIIIFANILDNAIEAASLSYHEKKIAVSLAERNYYIIFETINTYGNQLLVQNGNLRSTKKGHSGLGIVSVNKTVKRYGGILKRDYDDTIFKMTVFLPVEKVVLNNI